MTETSLTDRSLYESRRHLHGTDSAVLRIGNEATKAEFLSVLQNPLAYTREELLSALFRNYSGAAYGDAAWRKTDGGWTTPEVSTQYGQIRTDFSSLDPLSLDPGFITHLDKIAEFIKSGEVPANDYEDAREKIREKLGKRTVYRGMSLFSSDLENIKRSGIISPLAGHVLNSDNPVVEFEAKALSVYPNWALESHYHHENRYSPFLSITSHKDLAIAVGKHFSLKHPLAKFYLFKIEIPEDSLVFYSEDGVKMPSKLSDSIQRNPDFGTTVSVDGEQSIFKFDVGVESFAYWKIDPEEIVEITQPNVSSSAWNGASISWT